MNNGRIWCVVNPTVGLPAFLGSVAIISFTVHFAVLNNTTWMADYWKGSSRGKAASLQDTTALPKIALSSDTRQVVINVAPVADGASADKTSFVITVGGKSAAVVSLDNAAPPLTEKASGDLALVDSTLQ